MTEHFTPDLLNLLQLFFFADSRISSVSRSKLSLSESREAALSVIWKRAGAGGEDGSLDFGEVLRWGEEDEFVAYKGWGGHFGRGAGECIFSRCRVGYHGGRQVIV